MPVIYRNWTQYFILTRFSLFFFFSKVQARKAFSSYLQRVQQRLLAESRTDTVPARPDKHNDHMVINDYFPNKWTYIDLYNTKSFRIILSRVRRQIPIRDLGATMTDVFSHTFSVRTW